VRFSPKHCPRAACPSHARGRFTWRRKGFYLRQCDGRWVQRFRCLQCRRTFSTQTFRFDYRLHKPRLHLALWRDLVSKTTHRQSARTLGCSRNTVADRVTRMGRHCELFHRRALAAASGRTRLNGPFQLDELETFEHNRRLSPVTVPVVVEKHSLFVVHQQCAPLPARGRLRTRDREKKLLRDETEGVRRSGSRLAVEACLRALARAVPSGRIRLESDAKRTYPGCAQRAIGARCLHRQLSSRLKASKRDPLFTVNHTLALLRDGVSRLVRRTWAAAKTRQRLETHLWIWVCYRNYIRPRSNHDSRTTAAMRAGITSRRMTAREVYGARLFEWRMAR
jgi:transposase-like protein